MRPDRVPQLADAREVFAALTATGTGTADETGTGTRFTALVPNLTGLREAVAAGVREVAIFAAASEGFSQRNTNRSIAQSLLRVRRRLRRGAATRASASAATYRRRSGVRSTAPSIRDASASLRGSWSISASSRWRSATRSASRIAGQVPEVVDAALAHGLRVDQLALHFHDTRGQALANVMAALPLGVRTFDASAGGLGGCPFAPGATGNLATEDLVYLLDGLGYETGVSLSALLEASAFIESRVGHPLPSRLYRASR